MSQEDKKTAVRRKLFPVETCKFNGVPIEVRPLPAGEVTEAMDFLFDFFIRASSVTVTREFLSESTGTLYRYLNQCVVVPDDPDMNVEDLPFSAMPDVIDCFLKHTLNPGNWQARLQEWKEIFGVSTTLKPGENPSQT